MRWSNVLSAFFGLKSLAVEDTARLFPEGASQIVGDTFEDATISVGQFSRFKLCRFSKCRFEWKGEAIGKQAKIFLSCDFDDCDYGMPVEEFTEYTYGATMNQQYAPRLTRQEALEEAVRRVHQRQPSLTERCLDPSSQAEREHLAQWVNAEYRKILMDA